MNIFNSVLEIAPSIKCFKPKGNDIPKKKDSIPEDNYILSAREPRSHKTNTNHPQGVCYIPKPHL